ncbi:MAG: hypothetical protein OK449_06290 [Thaumarchaeota archaeon]|nr:hypothetical protein [Nitrososphaerota archaeon]
MSEQATGAADIVNIKCNCCGRMIPSKPYVKDVRGRAMRFCGRECYKLYLSYKLPRIMQGLSKAS